MSLSREVAAEFAGERPTLDAVTFDVSAAEYDGHPFVDLELELGGLSVTVSFSVETATLFLDEFRSAVDDARNGEDRL